MMGRMRVVFRKEVVDNFRDKRSLIGAFFFPFLGPAMLAMMIVFVGQVSANKDKTLDLPVVGAERAATLVSFLEQHDVNVLAAPEDPEAAVKSEDANVVLVIPESYPERFREARPASIELVLDESRRTSRIDGDKAERLLEAYSEQIGRLRLMVRGVSPTLTTAVAIEKIDVSTAQSRAAMLLAMLPYFIVMAVFMGGIYIAIDTTAGELERGSLEPLFMNPVARWELLLGKFAAVVFFSIIGLALSVIGFSAVPHLISTDALGMQIRLEPAVLVRIFFLFLPISILASSIQMLVASFSKSFKEAQTQVSFIMLIPVLPGIFLALVPFDMKLWMMTIPTFGEQVLAHKMLRGDEVELVYFIVSALCTTLLGSLTLFIATRFFQSERVFSG